MHARRRWRRGQQPIRGEQAEGGDLSLDLDQCGILVAAFQRIQQGGAERNGG
jgi:hypothetical protein